MKKVFEWFDGFGNSKGIENPQRRTLLKSLPFLAAIPIAIEMEDKVVNAKAVPLDLTTRYLFIVDARESERTVDSLRIALAAQGVTGVIYPTLNPEKAIQIYKLEGDLEKS